MKYTVEFRKEALQDILEAITWYEHHREGLGDEFFISLENSKHLIEQNPLQFPKKYKGFRKAITKRFPYIIYFKVENPEKVLVYAVLHMKRSEKHLRQRSE